MQLSRFLFLVCLSLLTSLASSQTVIKVGGYEFPPFVNTRDGGEVNGATLDLIDALNRSQSDYRFEFVLTSPKRRYLDFSANRYDMMMFESAEWGWDEHDVAFSNSYMSGGEVYIAYNREGRDQGFFDVIDDKRIVGILGYHYGFADFNADEEFLSSHFKILLSSDHYRNIRLVLVNRPELAEVAVVTRSFLGDYLTKHPQDKQLLLISDKLDQLYQHRVLLRKNAKIPLERVNQLLIQLETSGAIDKLRQQYQLNTF